MINILRNKWLSVVFAVLLPGVLLSQDLDKAISNSEKFSHETGVLLRKDFYEHGKVGSANIRLLAITNIASNTKSFAVRFENEYITRVGSETKIGTVDSDELEGLINALEHLKNNILPSTVDIYSEVIYRSRGGFETGAFRNQKTNQWDFYLKLDKYDGRSFVFLGSQDIPVLIDKLITIRDQIKTL